MSAKYQTLPGGADPKNTLRRPWDEGKTLTMCGGMPHGGAVHLLGAPEGPESRPSGGTVVHCCTWGASQQRGWGRTEHPPCWAGHRARAERSHGHTGSSLPRHPRGGPHGAPAPHTLPGRGPRGGGWGHLEHGSPLTACLLSRTGSSSRQWQHTARRPTCGPEGRSRSWRSAPAAKYSSW